MVSTASGSKHGMTLIHKNVMAWRPLIKNQLTRYQTLARVSFICTQCECETVGSQYISVISGLKCQQGQLKGFQFS